MDTFDPKPEAVAEHRSPFKPIDTVVPGLRFTELLAKTAKVADKLAVVRCMHQPTPGDRQQPPQGVAVHLLRRGPRRAGRHARHRQHPRPPRGLELPISPALISWCPATASRRPSRSLGVPCPRASRPSRPAGSTCRPRLAGLEPRPDRRDRRSAVPRPRRPVEQPRRRPQHPGGQRQPAGRGDVVVRRPGPGHALEPLDSQGVRACRPSPTPPATATAGGIAASATCWAGS